MKKIVFSLLAISTLFLAGCLETTEEVTLNSNGSGTLVTTSDLSAAIGVAKGMGGNDAEKMNEGNRDTVLQLASQVDSIQSLTPEEKELARTGTMRISMNVKDEKAFLQVSLPIKKLSDIPKLQTLTTKLMAETMNEVFGGENTGIPEMPEPTTFDSYYDIVYKDDKIVKSVNKEKYSKVESDEYLQGMKEATGMGIPVTSTQVINLPRPAKSVDGKNVKLSDDKKKVTVKVGIDEFFSDPSSMEFKIEY